LKRSFIYILLVSFLFLIAQKTSAQSVSNEGNEFWAVFPTHVPSGDAYARITIFISSKSNSSGNVTVGNNTYPFNVLANNIAEIEIPRSFAYISDKDAEKVISNKSIHIVVDEGKPKVAAYAHIYARARSEAYLILPVEAHGRRYFSMDTQGTSAPNQSSESKTPGRAFMVILATSDNTVVNIKEPFNETARQIVLPKAGDLYEITADGSLTGTEVEIAGPTSNCQTFAAYSGHSGLALYSGSYDPLAQQLYPVASWGRVYGVVPFKDRYYFFKIIASEDNTKISIDNLPSLTLNKGESFTSDQWSVFKMIAADKPISVAQFTLSQDEISAPPNVGMVGDPDMVILNPVEYSIKNITVFSSDLENINQKYLNIFIKTKFRNTFKINGTAPTTQWQTVAINPDYSYLQEPASSRSLTLTADDNFNAIAYGFGDHESYAYSAGTNLATNQFLLLQNKVTNQETTAACLGQATDFKLTLPYLLTRIIWKLENGTIIFDDKNPSPAQTVVAGQTLYKYLAPVNMTFSQLGQFKISATGTVAATPGSCLSGDLELNFVVDVDPLPKAIFDVVATGCADEILTFTDKSESFIQQKQISKWLWDFGDGEISTAQNPKHAYASSGSYAIKLMVGSEGGCLSDVEIKNVVIKQKVNALFDSPSAGCSGANVLFIDKSSMNIGTIIKWVWDMGDGKLPLQKTTSLPFNYQFDKPGEYTISLVAYGNNGCVSTPFTKQITINALPKSDFILPDVCVKDGETTFVNLSTNIDDTSNNLTYSWDFDDPASGASNTSIAINGKHQFTIARDYNIKLTITNENGCKTTTIKKFTVNGKDPISDFEIVNKNNLCSNRSFTVINKAFVKDFGGITKIEWFINGVQQNVSPAPQPSYDFKVQESTLDLTVNLTMIAYSGTKCFQVHEELFTLRASPKLEFDLQQPLCFNSKPVQLVARELGNLRGTGKFSGVGVSDDGIFDPGVAGVGDVVITYTFNVENGCYETINQTIKIYPIPIVYAGKDEYILIGGERKLEATATGKNLKYKWTPSAGLDHDDILNPIVKPQQNTNYTLTVTSGDGCAVIDQVYVYLLQEVKAPNSFTPNGDGVNDVWNVKYLDSYPKVTVEIFNRNGQRIYYSRGYSVPFDGNFNNQTLPVGTYYYIINPNNGEKAITGNLTIIR
jgi:gliding motility-associated-like protein